MLWLISEMWIVLALAALIGAGAATLALRPWMRARKKASDAPADWEAERRRLSNALADARKAAAAKPAEKPYANGAAGPAVSADVTAAAADLRAEIGALRRELAGSEAEYKSLAGDAAKLADEAEAQSAKGDAKSSK